jgi:hypothetical protein
MVHLEKTIKAVPVTLDTVRSALRFLGDDEMVSSRDLDLKG